MGQRMTCTNGIFSFVHYSCNPCRTNDGMRLKENHSCKWMHVWGFPFVRFPCKGALLPHCRSRPRFPRRRLDPDQMKGGPAPNEADLHFPARKSPPSLRFAGWISAGFGGHAVLQSSNN